MAASNGFSSTASIRSLLTLEARQARWLSMSVSPWPGKCLAVTSTRFFGSECAPSMYAATCCATSSGFSPKERMLITGFSGLLLTSATGAKIHWTPSARASRAVTSPSKRDASRSPRRAERHVVGETRACGHAHGRAALEIARRRSAASSPASASGSGTAPWRAARRCGRCRCEPRLLTINPPMCRSWTQCRYFSYSGDLRLGTSP